MGIFGNTFGPAHLIIILVVVVLLFGAPKLPGLARSVAQSMKIFRTEIKQPKSDSDTTEATVESVDSDPATPVKKDKSA
jgi:sec-independent protein translocase protein TatA